MGENDVMAALVAVAVATMALPDRPWSNHGLGDGPGDRARALPRMPLRIRRTVAATLAVGATAILLGGGAWLVLALACVGAAAGFLTFRSKAVFTAREMLACAAFFDSLAACLDAGLSVDRAVATCLVALPVPGAAGAAIEESSSLLALGCAPDSAWQPVARIPQLAAIARAAARSGDGGTRFAAVARHTAADLRAHHQSLEQRRAARAGVLVTAPLALCFLPAFLCLGLAPVIVSLVTTLEIW